MRVARETVENLHPCRVMSQAESLDLAEAALVPATLPARFRAPGRIDLGVASG